MALLAKTGSFTKKSDTTGNQSVTGIGFQPKVVFFFGDDRTSDGAHANAQAFFGVANDDSGEPGVDAFLSFKDNVATSVGAAGLAVVRMEMATDVDGTLVSEGTFVSMDSDGFTINWNRQDSEARIICYLALGGDDITDSNTFSGNVGTSTGNWSPTGLGFQPDFIMMFNTSSQNTDNSIGIKDVWGGFGAAAEDLSQAYMAFFAQHNTAAGSAIAHRNLKPDLAFGQITGSQRLEGEITSFNADGFTINWGTHDAYAAIYQGLALQGLRTKVGTFQQRTDSGPQTITGLPFKPKGIIFFSAQNTATTIANDMQNMFGFADDNGNNESIWWGASYQTNPTVADSYLDRTKAIKFMTQGTPTLLADAVVSEMGNGYFTVDWGTADANARHIGYIAFGEDIPTDEIAVGNESQATGATTNQLTWSHTVANNSNRVLIVDIAGWGDRTVTGVTFNGDALTQIDRRSNDFGFVESWVLANPDVATGDIVVSFSGSSYSNAGAVDFYNANPDDPIGADNQAGTTTGTQTVNLTTLYAGSMVVDSAWRRGGPAMSADSPQGEFYNSIYLGGVLTGAGSYKAGGATGSKTMSWTTGTSDWMSLVFEVRSYAPPTTQTVTAKANIQGAFQDSYYDDFDDYSAGSLPAGWFKWNGGSPAIESKSGGTPNHTASNTMHQLLEVGAQTDRMVMRMLRFAPPFSVEVTLIYDTSNDYGGLVIGYQTGDGDKFEARPSPYNNHVQVRGLGTAGGSIAYTVDTGIWYVLRLEVTDDAVHILIRREDTATWTDIGTFDDITRSPIGYAGFTNGGYSPQETNYEWFKIFDVTSQTVSAKAYISAGETVQTVTAKARIVCISIPELVSPANFAVDQQSPVTLVWKIPEICDGSPVHAHVQVDQTDNTFGDIEAELFSFRDSGFEYWDGDSWEPYPTSGVSNDYAGNEARVQVTLTPGTKYWRVRGGRG